MYWLTILLLTFVVTQPISPTDAPSLYVYVRQSQNDSATIESIDPSTLLTTTLFTVQTPSLPSGDYITFLYSQSVLSPDGKRVMLVHGTPMGYDRVLEIVDLESGTSQQSEPFQVYPPHEGRLDRDRPTFYWSPTGHFIAFNRFVDLLEDEPIIQTYLYDVAQNQLRVLNDQQATPLHLAWSPDGQELAVIEADAAQNVTSITVYDVETGEKTKSVLLDEQVPLPPAAYIRDDTLCMLSWSPSGRYLSYIAACSPSMMMPIDVYVTELSTGDTHQVTSSGADIILAHNIKWLPDDDELVISTLRRMHERNFEFSGDTVVYSTTAQKAQPFNVGFVVDLADDYSVDVSAFTSATINAAGEVEQSSMRYGRTASENQQPIVGCNLALSPDEKILVLLPQIQPSSADALRRICHLSGERLMFIKGDYVIEKQFEVGQRVIPLGWMR